MIPWIIVINCSLDLEDCHPGTFCLQPNPAWVIGAGLYPFPPLYQVVDSRKGRKDRWGWNTRWREFGSQLPKTSQLPMGWARLWTQVSLAPYFTHFFSFPNPKTPGSQRENPNGTWGVQRGSPGIRMAKFPEVKPFTQTNTNRHSRKHEPTDQQQQQQQKNDLFDRWGKTGELFRSISSLLCQRPEGLKH